MYSQRIRKRVYLCVCALCLCATMWLLSACRNQPEQTPSESTDAVSVTEPLTEPEEPRETEGATLTEAATEEPEEPQTIVFDDSITEETLLAPDEQVTQPEYLYFNDFSDPIGASDPDWYANDNVDVSNGTLTNSNRNHCYVAMRHKVKAETLSLSLELQANRPGEAPHCSAFVGLRLPAYDDQYAAVGSNGIWIAFQNNSVGIINTWPTVSLVQTDYDFRSMRQVYIEDNMETGEIAVYVDGEDGERALVLRVIIEDGRNVFLVDAKGQTRLTTTFNYDIDNQGYVCFWGHLNDGGVAFDNVCLEWKEAVKTPYVCADPAGIRDLYSDTWTGTDGAGRTLVVSDADVEDKLVGIFYEIWHVTTHSSFGFYDHNAIYQEGGVEAIKEAVGSGPVSWPHYWAQPYFGYYISTDRWIIRKHASMLADIGVDFIYLDVTNGQPFPNVYKVIFQEFRALRDAGVDTPDICFFLSNRADLNSKVFDDLWDNLYATGQYSDLYAMYKGKPLILGDLSAIDEERLSMFTVRRCWALQSELGDGKDYWNWMCETPQVASYNSQTGEIEEISISAGILVNLSIGRSYTVAGGQPPLSRLPDGTLDYFQFNLPSTAYGLLFAEQMKRAEEVDPYVLLVTGWNEWTAARWETTVSGVKIANTYLTNSGEDWTKSYYVDAFNPEFSRDIEPMSGGFGDNYYYQLAAFLRLFKGSRNPLPADGQTEIDPAGDVTQWDSVWPEYRDTATDTYHRDSIGFGGYNYYTNNSGRNDILTAKVSRSGDWVYFLVECQEDITAPEGSNWMNLFLDSDCDSTTGWAGYDFVLGRQVSALTNGTGTVSVEAFSGDSWDRTAVGTAEITLNGRYLTLKVSAALCGITGDFDFKWADNSVDDGEVMAFLDQGDAAPNGRFNYAYRTGALEASFNETLAGYLQGGVGFVAGKSYMAASDSLYTVLPASTAVTPQLYRGRLFLPASALSAVDGISVSLSDDGSSATVTVGDTVLVFAAGADTVSMGIHTVVIPVAPYLSDGQLYIPLNVVAHFGGMNLLTDQYGRALMTPASVDGLSDEDITKLLNALDRAI
ncbi:MAG: stalk domain-containing protein [Eubacteriales bacterium]